MLEIPTFLLVLPLQRPLFSHSRWLSEARAVHGAWIHKRAQLDSLFIYANLGNMCVNVVLV
jgi:hypothetical protein